MAERILATPHALSHAEMVRRIEGGNSVLFGGRVITNVKDLPPPEQVAVSIPDKRAALRDLERQQREINTRIENTKAEIEAAEELETAEREMQQEVEQVRAGGGRRNRRTTTAPPPDEPTFGTDNTPLSQFRGLTRSQALEVEGVGDATADKIEASLQDTFGEGFAEEGEEGDRDVAAETQTAPTTNQGRGRNR